MSAVRAPAPLPPVAVREDAHGYREEATFLEVGGERVYAVAHLPAEPSSDEGVVICCPILVEHLTNYRREVLLARRLAAGGIPVQRFHYRGAGHSTGAESEVTLDTMVEDALAASEHLRSLGEVRRTAFLGTRFGALVAVRAAGAQPGGPLVLWEPVAEVDRYFRELIRARLVHELKEGRRSRSDAAVWTGEMTQHGAIEILGYPLHSTLYQSVRGIRLQDLLPDPAPETLLLRMGPGADRQGAVEGLRAHILERGGTVYLEILPEDPVWLFVGQRVMKSAETPVQLTADWLLSKAGRG